MMELVKCADISQLSTPGTFRPAREETDVRSKTNRKKEIRQRTVVFSAKIALRDELEFGDRDISVCVSNQCDRCDAKENARVGVAQIQDSNAG